MIRKLKSMVQEYLFILLTLIVVQTNAQQKQGTISGLVLTSDEKPAVGVNVIIESLNTGTITRSDGTFEINNINYGTYTLQFSLIGLKKKSINILVDNKQTSIDAVILKENQEDLDEIMVIAHRLNQFAHKESEYVARVPLKNIDNPQSYSVVTGELLKEQLTSDLPSAFKSITGGGYVQSNDGNVSVYLRGFRSDAHIRNGGIAWIKAPIDPQNIERIEVIKGPAGLYYGTNVNNLANYGGIVNKVTKQAFNGEQLDLGYSAGNWEQNRLTVDYNTVIDAKDKVFFRINGAYNTENSFQDQGIIRDYMIAPSLTFKLSEKLSVKANFEFNNSKRNLNFARGVSSSLISDETNSWDDLNWDYYTNYGTNGLAGKLYSTVFQTLINYSLSDRWTSKTTYTSAAVYADANYLRVVMSDETTVSRYLLQYDPRETANTHLQQDFLGIYDSGAVEYKFVGGVSYLTNRDDYQRTGVWNALDDVDTNDPVIEGLTNEQFESSIADETKNKTIQKFQTLGFYAFNALTLHKKLTVTAGLRFDRFINENTMINGASSDDAYNQNSWGSKLGINYNPFEDKISLFANYMDGLTNNAPSDNGSGEVVSWDASKAKQVELGTKMNFFNGKLKSTISYYHININNDIITNEEGISVQEGETLSKGFEMDIIANPLPGLNTVVGYTKNHATLEKVSSGSEGIVGNSLSYTPEVVWNFWLSYQLFKGSVNGLGFGFGGNYMSEIYNSTSNNFGSEAFTTYDATIFYKKHNYKISIKADNILDTEYYNGYGIPQKPFNFRFGITYNLFK